MSNITMFWKGKDVNKLTKKELVEALVQMNNLYKNALETHIHDLEMLK
jgi:hypothetical protein